MLRPATPTDSEGIQPRLTAPGTRMRATGTRTGTVHQRITPGHSTAWQRTSGAER